MSSYRVRKQVVPDHITPQAMEFLTRDPPLLNFIQMLRWLHQIQLGTRVSNIKFGRIYQQYQKFHSLFQGFGLECYPTMSELFHYIRQKVELYASKYQEKQIKQILRNRQNCDIESYYHIQEHCLSFLNALNTRNLFLLLSMIHKKFGKPKRIFEIYKKYYYAMNKVLSNCEYQLLLSFKNRLSIRTEPYTKLWGQTNKYRLKHQIYSVVLLYVEHFQKVLQWTSNEEKAEDILDTYKDKYKKKLKAAIWDKKPAKPRRRIMRLYGFMRNGKPIKLE